MDGPTDPRTDRRSHRIEMEDASKKKVNDEKNAKERRMHQAKKRVFLFTMICTTFVVQIIVN